MKRDNVHAALMGKDWKCTSKVPGIKLMAIPGTNKLLLRVSSVIPEAKAWQLMWAYNELVGHCSSPETV